MKKCFADVLTIVNGKNQRKVENPNGKYPIYGSGGLMGYADDYLCEANTVIIGRKGTINKPIYITEKFWNVDTAFGLTSNKDVLIPKYLYYFCCKYDFQQHNKTVTIPSLTKADLLQIEIEVPSIEEQENVVAKIGQIDLILEKYKFMIENIDSLIKSRFVEMFGDINLNDRNWPVKPLGELCKIYRGGSPRPINQYLGGDVPWIKIGDATKGDEIYLHSTKEHIITDGVKKSRMVKKGSLIFANCGVSLGFARIITFDGCIHDGWLSFEDIDESLDKVFLLLSLNQMTEYFRVIAPDGTQPNLNTAIMKDYQQIIPPIDLQRNFIEFIKFTDKSKLAVQKSIDTLQTLNAKLMQEYFG